MITRREFLAASAVAAGWMLVPRVVRAGSGGLAWGGMHMDDGEPYFDWVKAGEKDWVAMQDGGNSLVVVGDGGGGTDAGLTLIDCKNAPFGAALRREAVGVAGRGKPLKQVINTHHHADHTGGNHAFTKDLPVLAHIDCKVRVGQQVNKYIAQNKEAMMQMDVMARVNPKKRAALEKVRPEVVAYHDKVTTLTKADFEPTQTMKDSQEIEVGGVKMTLRHFGPGHTDNDVVVHIPSRNIVHTGDLLFNKRYPFIDLEGGASTAGWQEALKKVIELCDEKTVVVPGHGDLAGVAALHEQIEFFDKVRDMVGKAMKEGKNRADVMKLPADAFPGYQGTNWSTTLRSVFEEMQTQGGKK